MSRERALIYLPIEIDPTAESGLVLPPEQTMGESRAMIRESIERLLAFRNGGAMKNVAANSLWEMLMIESSAA